MYQYKHFLFILLTLTYWLELDSKYPHSSKYVPYLSVRYLFSEFCLCNVFWIACAPNLCLYLNTSRKKEFTDTRTSGSCPIVRRWSCFIFAPDKLSQQSPPITGHCPPTLADQAMTLTLLTPCLWVHLFTILAGITISTPPLWPCITNDHIGPLSLLSPRSHWCNCVLDVPVSHCAPRSFPEFESCQHFKLYLAARFLSGLARTGWLSTPSLCTRVELHFAHAQLLSAQQHSGAGSDKMPGTRAQWHRPLLTLNQWHRQPAGDVTDNITHVK